MGLNFRKSFKAGPIKVNLSKSGVGFSGGVKGGRVGVSSKGGVYASGGANGVYFRKSLNGKTTESDNSSEDFTENTDVEAVEVKQEDVDRMANFLIVFFLVILFLIGALWHPLRWIAGGIACLWIGFKVKKWLFG